MPKNDLRTLNIMKSNNINPSVQKLLRVNNIFLINCWLCATIYCHTVEYGKAHGDFKVDGKYTFEIGGRSKGFSQIAGVENSYIFADDWDMPDGAKLPLWMLGFLY